MTAPADAWNLNIHYHRVILNAAPAAPARVLDVGSGDGLLSFDLAAQGLQVMAIDPDAGSVERARKNTRPGAEIEFICGDVFTFPFEPGSFDMVTSSAMLHHVDTFAGLERMKELVRPGGVLALVSFATPSTAADHALAVGGRLAKGMQQLRGRYWEHNAPTAWPPPLSTNEMTELAANVLPGAQFRRHMSNRFSLVWQAP